MPHQVVHGDYGIGNLLMHRSRVVGLVDLEFLAVHERVFDLAYISFWMMQRVEAGVPYVDRSWSCVREMIAKYDSASAAPLTDEEWRVLPVEMARVPLHWVGEASYLPNATEAVARCAEQIALASWIVKHAGAIV